MVGLVIVAAVGIATALTWAAIQAGPPSLLTARVEDIALGPGGIRYTTQTPPIWPLIAAGAVALLAAAGLALTDRGIANRARRSMNLEDAPLAPRLVMASTRGVYAGPVTITVLIPAHNEELLLPSTIAALLAQSHPPARVIVVADNCTDSTTRIALEAGVEVFEPVGNFGKKAGALNQVLEWILPFQGENDAVMVMDADTILDEGFLAEAVRRLTDDRALMAIGGLFKGEEGHGLLGQFQRNEYIRYGRQIQRRRGRVFVLTGTASVFRPAALRAVAGRRGTSLPGVRGDVYDTVALTEDNELTIGLKSLGALMISPSQCSVVTELMPTWRTLWAQRLRWQRGALENIGAYGLTPQTLRYWVQQLGIGYSVVALGSYLLLCLLALFSFGSWVWAPFWLGLGAVFALERVITVWRGGWRARLLALLLFPELLFDMFLNVVYIQGIIDISTGRQARWKHLPRAQADRPATPDLP